MKMSRILALLLALMLALSAVAFAEDATEAPAAEATEAPADDEAAEAEADPVIAEFGDVQIRVSDALPQFESYYQMMSGYGFDMSAYAPYIKQQVLATEIATTSHAEGLDLSLKFGDFDLPVSIEKA